MPQISFWSWFVQVWRGKTFGRALMNGYFAKLLPSYRGKWLDLGAGPGPSYASSCSSEMQRIATDLKASTDVIALDAEQPFPFEAEIFDGALAINMLYTLRDPGVTVRELRRVVKSGGTLIATFPFFFPEYPEPHDYVRWTSEGTRLLLESSGWKVRELIAIGGPGICFGTSLLPGRGLWFWRVLWAPVCWLWDRCVRRSRVTYVWLVIAD